MGAGRKQALQILEPPLNTATTHASAQHCTNPCLSPAPEGSRAQPSTADAHPQPQTAWHSPTQPHLMLRLQERDEHLCQRMGLLVTPCRGAGNGMRSSAPKCT